MSEPTPPLFEVRSNIPGKGRGLVALTDIAKGARVIAEQPLLSLGSSFDIPVADAIQAFALSMYSPTHLINASVNKEVQGLVNGLSMTEQLAFHNLYNRSPTSPYKFAEILKCNALPGAPTRPIDGTMDNVLFTTLSKVNHACVPNCIYRWNERLGKGTLHAVHDIPEGDELTLDFCKHSCLTLNQRHKNLEAGWGFTCKCTLCSSSAADLAASDARRTELSKLFMVIHPTDIPSAVTGIYKDPAATIESCRKMIPLIEAEFGKASDLILYEPYCTAMDAAAFIGDAQQTANLARLTSDCVVVTEGKDSSSVVLADAKNLMINPMSHLRFGHYHRSK